MQKVLVKPCVRSHLDVVTDQKISKSCNSRLDVWRQMANSISSIKKFPGHVLASSQEGYVFDQMEGAVDTAIYLAPLDVPIAVIGPRGTGKGFVSRLIHESIGGKHEEFKFLDCREFKGRNSSLRTLSNSFQSKVFKTLVFKSPHLLQDDIQEKLARCIASRRLTLKRPSAYLPNFKLVALFPLPIERLIREGLLIKSLASCFSGYPIIVPSLNQRGHAVLRWADKILIQESKTQNKNLKGFSPDAQKAMLCHSWTGNISELRHRIVEAIKSTSRDWIMPIDLGLKAVKEIDTPSNSEGAGLFEEIDRIIDNNAEFVLSARQELELAIKNWCVNLNPETIIPLGLWLHDELVLAAIARYKGNQPKAAAWLQVPSRNVRRWTTAIQERENQRQATQNASDHSRLIREWVREMPREGIPPAETLEKILLVELLQLESKFDLACRASLLGVSIPTYRKKLKSLMSVKK